MSDPRPDPLKCFSPTVPDYRRYRQRYPAQLLDWAAERLGRAPRRVLDLGCGTGILTAALVARGWDVLGLDPNPDMLTAAREEVPGARLWRACAEATGLRAGALDLVVCGQAFHWFELETTLPELDRILAPGGLVMACWNLRAPEGSPWGAEYDALLHAHSRLYRGTGPAFLERLRYAVTDRDGAELELSCEERLDLATLLGRARSASYVAHGVDDLAAFEHDLSQLFGRHARDGQVTFPYRVVGLAWRRGQPPSKRAAARRPT